MRFYGPSTFYFDLRLFLVWHFITRKCTLAYYPLCRVKGMPIKCMHMRDPPKCKPQVTFEWFIYSGREGRVPFRSRKNSLYRNLYENACVDAGEHMLRESYHYSPRAYFFCAPLNNALEFLQ